MSAAQKKRSGSGGQSLSMANGRQYVAIAAGSNILSFTPPEKRYKSGKKNADAPASTSKSSLNP
jgi:hypothetical protein